MRVVVIGAGFAGLAAALRLALEGHEVEVLERGERPGGKAEGYRGIPSGPTVLTLPQITRALFERAGAAPPALCPVSPLTTYHYLGGRRFAPERDLEATLAQLDAAEGRAYRRLLEEARALYEGAARTFLLAPPPGLPQLTAYGLRHGLRAHPLSSLERLVRPAGPYLSPFFLRFATYMGANPYRAPAILHNIAWVELGLGVWHPQGGFSALACALEALCRAHGVTFRYGAAVGSLETAGGRVEAAYLQKGGRVRAEAFVAACDRAFTHWLLGRPFPEEPLGTSGFALQLDLEEDLGLSHHLLFSGDYRAEWAELERRGVALDPTIYLHTEGQRGFALVNAAARPVPDREEYARHLLGLLRARLPLPVREWRALAPQDYALTGHRGALYGPAPHGLLGALRPGWQLSGLSNLRQVGGTVHPGGGVPLALLSGWNGAGQLAGLAYDDLGAGEEP
ncbi:phytoene dehydrogenase-like protein [Deinobacterium chartae]|uniref:Phytoene dehydrogenase-like protein n=1 Tax=Deinobacterium chartae TaxID=521158 RepID=A0A841I1E3_9DEIO|nr:phytoene dehydrogenase-like protein [Deinobacterium chartae]